ncbi:MAG: VOC family protein [Microvirga sp.]
MSDSGRIAPDHLVVAARTLAEAVAWCEASFGVRPEGGGRHAFMGTHNKLLGLGDGPYPKTYLELIAIDPESEAPTHARWFDLDAPALQASLSAGPRLVHWVARTDDIDGAAAGLRAVGLDPGVPTAAERMTAQGLLRWTITLRDDGVRQAAGALPALIDWGASRHPSASLAASGVVIEGIAIGGVDAAVAARLGVDHDPGGAALTATLLGPRGRVELRAA